MPEDLDHWILSNLPKEWFEGPPEIEYDDDEILVVGQPRGVTSQLDLADIGVRFRSESREKRVNIAREAERRFGLHLSWGISYQDHRLLFSTLSVPVMTRLRMPERRVLDTLVESGVARSRSDALAWCVRLVERHESDWLQELRGALVKVGEVRAKGPK